MKNSLLTRGALALTAIIAITSCGSKTNSEQARKDYGASLKDSISIVKQEIDSCNSRISVLDNHINQWIRDFTTVGNPREVGTYMIYTPFRDKYPLTGTGLVARINDNGQFELIAALSGKHFDRISVKVPTIAISSEVVPNDQALNFRNKNLTTVLFTGEKADSIGNLISANQLNNIVVEYCQGDAVATWNMPGAYSKMISYTWQLYSGIKQKSQLERRVPMLHEKINLLRAHLDNTGTEDEDSTSGK